MIRSLLLFTLVLLLSIFTTMPALGQQQRCIKFDSYRAAGPPDNAKRFEACRSFCRDKSCNLDSLLANGWIIEQQRPYNVTQQPFAVSGQLDFPEQGYCACQGAEYILKKNTPQY